MNIMFIAPPAAGKGTYSALIKEKYGYSHIAAGDVLREEVSNKSEIGLKIKEIIESGKLIDNKVMKELLNQKFHKIDKNIPFIMDGYPRTLEQAKDFEDIMSENGLSIDKIIYLEIPLEEGLRRVLNRLICPSCKNSYNKTDNSDLVCPNCKATLVTRADDNEETYKTRYTTYLNETKPLLDYYDSLGKLVKIDATQDMDITLKEIEKWLA